MKELRTLPSAPAQIAVQATQPQALLLAAELAQTLTTAASPFLIRCALCIVLYTQGSYNLLQNTGMRTVPRQLPPFSLLVDDCGHKPRYIARYLGVTERTVKKWIREDHAPRAAMLALFFCTRWGREYVNCDAENHAIVMRGLAHAAEHRANQAEKRLKQSEKRLLYFFE